ncbi:hypothetical protein ACB092_10G147700 [Castanea dentata]
MCKCRSQCGKDNIGSSKLLTACNIALYVHNCFAIDFFMDLKFYKSLKNLCTWLDHQLSQFKET